MYHAQKYFVEVAPGVDIHAPKVPHTVVVQSCGDTLLSTALEDSRWDGIFRHVLLQLQLEYAKTPPEKSNEERYD